MKVAEPDPALHARRHQPHRLLKRGHHVALVVLQAPVARQRHAAAPACTAVIRMSHATRPGCMWHPGLAAGVFGTRTDGPHLLSKAGPAVCVDLQTPASGTDTHSPLQGPGVTCTAQGAGGGRSPRGAGSERWHPSGTARTRASLAGPPLPHASAACPGAAARPAGAVQVSSTRNQSLQGAMSVLTTGPTCGPLDKAQTS